MQFDDFQAPSCGTALFGTTSAPAVTAPGYRQPRDLVGQSKACTGCGSTQDLSEFAVKRGGRAATCRACQKIAADAHYQRNRPRRISDATVRNAAYRKVMVERRDGYLAQCVCEDCCSTVSLRLTSQPGYSGQAVHQVIAKAQSLEQLDTALAASRVLCDPCLGSSGGNRAALELDFLRVALADGQEQAVLEHRGVHGRG